MTGAASRITLLHAWIVSLRLRTLPLACCGILTGNAVAFAQSGRWQARTFWFSLCTALLLQILANLANDYGDFSKAADTPRRLGPRRGMQLGLISPAAMRGAILCVTLLAILSGSLLLFTAGHSRQDIVLFLLLGLFSLVAALTYTIGRHAYGYHGLGDLAVLVFFGWVAVGGSFYLQTRALAWPVFLPATACGLLSAVVLNVNNLRDLEEDLRHGKITFAAMLGMRWAKIYVQILLLASLLCLAAFALLCLPHRPWAWLFLIALPFFHQNAAILRRARQPEDFQPQLATALKLNMAALGGLAAGLLVRG